MLICNFTFLVRVSILRFHETTIPVHTHNHTSKNPVSAMEALPLLCSQAHTHLSPPSSGPQESVQYGQHHWAPLPRLPVELGQGEASWTGGRQRREALSPLPPCQCRVVMLSQSMAALRQPSLSYSSLWAPVTAPCPSDFRPMGGDSSPS